MNITFRQLEIFLLAGKLLNFSRVAATLEMTPPAITKQIAALEKECEMQLFEQVGKRMYLTPAGEVMLEKAEQLNKELDKFKKFVTSMNINEQVIDISLGHTYQNIIFPLIHEFQQKHKDVIFNIYVEPREKQYKLILENTRDFGLISTREIPEEFGKVKLANITYQLYGIIEAGHALPNKVSQLQDETFVLIADDQSFSDHAFGETQLKKHNLENNKVIRLDSFAAIKEAIACGLGIGFLPTTLVTKSDNLKQISIANFAYKLPLYIVYHRYKKLSKLHKEFISFISSNIPS